MRTSLCSQLLRLGVLLGLIPWLSCSAWAAAPGDLDPTFGTGGVVNMHLGPVGTDGRAYSVDVQRDGKILLGGNQASSYGLMRLQTNGTLDTNFGTGGIVIPPIFELGQVDGMDMGLQSDGKIIVAGVSFAAVQLDTNGLRDWGFGGTGQAQMVWPYAAMAFDMVVQADNKIVFGGYAQMAAGGSAAQDFAVVRFQANGIADNSFGIGGRVTTDFGNQIDRCRRLAMQKDGKILAAGYSANFSTTNLWVLARYTTNGALDASFGTNGKMVALIGRSGFGEFPEALAVQADGKILFGGVHSNLCIVLRFHPNGSIDTSFGINGQVLTQTGTRASSCRSLALQRDGKIVAAGFAYGATYGAFSVVRYQPDGSRDATFGIDGLVTTSVGYANDVVLQPNGGILVGGEIGSGNFGLLRYLGDPVLTEPPVITLQPASQTVAVGAMVTFTVTATGTAPYYYSWQFNGGDIEGATNSILSLTNVSLSAEGSYSVSVSNDFGSTLSSNAVLNVNRPPVANPNATVRLVISGNGSNAMVVLDGTLSADPDDDALTYLWLSSGSTNVIASGAVATMAFPLGIHSVELNVSDGFAAASGFVTFEVISFSEALHRLSGEVKASTLKQSRKFFLRVPLLQARRLFEHHRLGPGIIRLERFQRRVHRLVEPHQPELAASWIEQAQRIIDATRLLDQPAPSLEVDKDVK